MATLRDGRFKISSVIGSIAWLIGALRSPGTYYILAFSLLYATVTIHRAVIKPLWYDEFAAFYLSSLPDVREIWQAVRGGIDSNPPLFYFLTKASVDTIGHNTLALRLPSIVGFWFMCVSIFYFVSRRASLGYAFLAMMIALTSGAYAHAYEARPYGVLLGATGGAALGWQRWNSSRALSIGCVSGFLLVAAASHCYGILLVVPFMIAEIVKTGERSKIDVCMWLAILSPITLLPIYVQLMASRSSAVTSAFLPSLEAIPNSYFYLINNGTSAIIFAALVFATLYGGRRVQLGAGLLKSWSETALVLSLCAIPVFGFVVGRVVGVYQLRYTLPALIGLTLLFPLLLSSDKSIGRLLATGLNIMLALSFFVSTRNQNDVLSWRERFVSSGLVNPARLLRAQTGYPVVVGNGFLFLELQHTSHLSFNDVIYLTDPAYATKATGADLFEIQLPKFSSLFRLVGQALPYSQFTQANRQFILISSRSHFMEWIVDKLINDGKKLDLQAQSGEFSIYLASD